MATRMQIDERARKAALLYRHNLDRDSIAIFLGISKRQVRRDLARPRELNRLMSLSIDGNEKLGETLQAFEEMEREALEKFARVAPESNVAVGYLKCALNLRKEIKKLQQEAGLMITVLPLEDKEIRAAIVAFLIMMGNKTEKNTMLPHGNKFKNGMWLH